jgi:hypothetical protein
MSFWNWQDTLNCYKYYSKSNTDFLEKLKTLPINGYDCNTILPKNIILNNDLVEATTTEPLVDLYKNNKLITIRLGCVESNFLIEHNYDLITYNHMSQPHGKRGNDKFMRENAGLYYKHKNNKNRVHKWWCNNTSELLHNSVLMSCYCFLNMDLPLWALLDMKGTFYNFDCLKSLVLKHSANKKILFIGYNTETIKHGYNNIDKMWNFEIPKFSMRFVKTPQTTAGMVYPDDSMIETTDKLIDEIDTYSDFDVALVSCGAYSAPIINILRKKYANKNLLYIGSKIFEIFGSYSHGMPKTKDPEANLDNWFQVLETRPEGCENHPEPKYWKN